VTHLPLLATAGSGISINGNALSTPVEVLVAMTLLSLIPGALLMVTGFTRILIVSAAGSASPAGGRSTAAR
jgi:flagellar biosynthesis protein FliP